MKRFSLFLAILCLVLLTSSCCDQVIELRGLDSFRYATCSLGLTSCLIPPDLLEDFSPLYGDYYYRDAIGDDGRVKVIMYLVYPETTYGVAKQYCIENMTLGETRVSSFEGFAFIDNLALDMDHPPDTRVGYPRWFNLFSYNDSSHTLLFLGYYGCRSSLENERTLALTDFPEFMRIVYSDCFDD